MIVMNDFYDLDSVVDDCLTVTQDAGLIPAAGHNIKVSFSCNLIIYFEVSYLPSIKSIAR